MRRSDGRNVVPNTVVLISDEHNPRYSSVHRHPTVRTPNMKKLAERGTVFENAYCPSPLCLPSRSAFLTGKRVHEISTYSNCTVNMGFNYPTYGRVLAEQGVHTVHVGKVHAYNHPAQLGFSEMLEAEEYAPPGDPRHGRTPLMIRPEAANRAAQYGVRDRPFQRDLASMGAAIRWLSTTAPGIKGPWTLCVNLEKPHFPHYVTRKLWDMYADDVRLPTHRLESETACHPYMQDLRKHFQTHVFTDREIRGQRQGYFGCVTFVDRQLGRLMAALEQIGELDRTNVVYSSDHGELLGKFDMWWKCTLLDDAARVPLIAAGPDFSRNARVRTPVDLHDLQAAIFSAARADRPECWHGTPLGEIPEDDRERVVFSEYHGHGTRSGAFMIRKGDWKLIYNLAGPHQLFNLAEDPEELTNLHAMQREKGAELEEHLRAVCDPEVENCRAHAFERSQLESLARRG